MCHGMLIETLAVERHQLSASRFSGEPELYELLHDPIARALMAADKVDCGDVYTLLRKTRGNVASRDSVR
jgi:hypothetical protein